MYKFGLIRANSFKRPLIVVGNLSVGGTGKTPFISSLTRYLLNQNLSVGIVSRGYKATLTSFPHQVSNVDSAFGVGDEAFMLYQALRVPVVISPKRSDAVNYLLDNNQVDVVISDDGLQHYSMNREIEIVLFDGARQFGNKLILPFGPLREPISRLRSVDYVVQNGTQENKYTQHNAKIAEISLVNVSTKEEKPLDYLSKEEVVAVAGIGNPNRFFASLENYVAIKSKLVFPDHHAFELKDFDRIHEDKLVVMTEKDAVKCQKFAKKNWFYLRVEMRIENALLVDIVSKVRQLNNRIN